MLISTTALGRTIRVPEDYSSIQNGINAAQAGDTVLVAPGTYVENIDFIGKAITVTSEGGPATTIIDGDRGPPVVKFVSGEGRDSVLTGFTVRNAYTSREGGGIQIINSSPTIKLNIIRDNLTTGRGGSGIGIEDGSPLIQGNLITNNLADGPGSGGGIYIVGVSPEIINNTISYNTSELTMGGGIYIDWMRAGLIRDNIIIGNTAQNGGGIYVRLAVADLITKEYSKIIQNLIIGNSAIQHDFLFPSKGGGISLETPSTFHYPLFLNNTIADNHADLGSAFSSNGFNSGTRLINNIIIGAEGEIAFSCGDYGGFPMPIMAFNNVFSPMADAYEGNCIDPTGTNNNISLDPLFVVPLNDDFHLRSGSPAIDSGDNSAPWLPATDLDGNTRLRAYDCVGLAVVDMGVYEGFKDADGDGVTDCEDDFPNDATKATPSSATGTGTISVDTSANAGTALQDVQALLDSDPSLNQTNKPAGYQFPDGLVTFKITGVPNGATVQVTITFPSDIPANAKYYKVNDNGFYEFTDFEVLSDNKTIRLTLTEGDGGDNGPANDGEIMDPGGVAVSTTSKGSATGGGGGGG